MPALPFSLRTGHCLFPGLQSGGVRAESALGVRKRAESFFPLLPRGGQLLLLPFPLLRGPFDELLPRPPALPHRDQVPLPLVQLFDASRQFNAHGLEVFLCVGNRESALLQIGFVRGELGEPGYRVLRQLVEFLLKRLQLSLDLKKPVASEQQLELFPFLAQSLVSSGATDLTPEVVDLPLDLPDEILEPGQVRLGRFELVPGRAPAGLVFRYPRGLLEDAPSVFSAFADDLVHHALLHHRVGAGTEAGVHQQVLDVEKPAGDLVQEVVAFAGTKQPARHRNLAEFDRQGVVRVVDRQGYFRHPERLAKARSAEDHVLHAVAANRSGPLFSEDPADGLDNVRLAAAVGTYDGGDPPAEGDLDLGQERLEPENFDIRKPHLSSSFLRAGASRRGKP